MQNLKSFLSSSSSSSQQKENMTTPPSTSKAKSKCGCGSKKKTVEGKADSVESIVVKGGCCCSSNSHQKSKSCCSDEKSKGKSCYSENTPKENSCCSAVTSKEKSCCSETDSNNDALVISSDHVHPANLICELCKLFYNNGWVTGTGGGISIRKDDEIYLAPSGVQKERIVPLNIFVMSLMSQKYIRKPLNLKPSACTPLFMAAYTMRDAGACIHTHSQNAVMCTLLFDKVFEISSIEQIKALPKVTEKGNMWYSDKLVIPIIENTEKEEDLEASLREAIKAYPNTTAVLVKRHGIYVWGETVWKAKVYNEAIDYLLELAVKMKLHGIPTVKENTN